MHGQRQPVLRAVGCGQDRTGSAQPDNGTGTAIGPPMAALSASTPAMGDANSPHLPRAASRPTLNWSSCSALVCKSRCSGRAEEEC